MAIGLLYTAVSRGTTLGDDDGSGSAVYFKGATFTPDRIRNLTFKANSAEEFKKAKERRYWVNYLQNNHQKSLPRIHSIKERQQTIHEWAATTTYSFDTLYDRIAIYKQRST